jgi:lysophospholipase L1-like esterase
VHLRFGSHSNAADRQLDADNGHDTVLQVYRRVVAALTVSILWASALVVIDRGSNDSPVFAPVAVNSSSWERENDYIFWSNRYRLGEDPLLTTQNGRGEHPNPNVVRVLAVGDSATFGLGVGDLSIRWQEKLERLLDQRTSPGTFDVTTMAMWGASTYRFADWLTPDVIRNLKPDIIIIAVNGNDAVPTGDERLICPDGKCPRLQTIETTDTFRACMADTANIAPADRPMLNRVCLAQTRRANPDVQYSESEQNAALLNGVYGKQLRQAHEQVISAAGNIPVGVFPTFVEPGDIDLLERLLELWESYGALRAPEVATRRVVTEHEGQPGVWVNPRDRHPGPRLTTAYAKDVAELILETVPTLRINVASGTAQPRPLSLVDNYLPYYSEMRSDERSAVIEFYPWVKQEDALYTQFYPCADVGRVHARVMFDPRITAGTEIEVRVEGIDGTVYGTGYIDDTYHTRELGLFKSGEPVTVTIDDQGLTGVLIVPEDASTCDVEQITYERLFQVWLTRS